MRRQEINPNVDVQKSSLTEQRPQYYIYVINIDFALLYTSITDELNVNYGISVSVSTEKRTLAEFGMYGRIARWKPFLSAANRKKRLQFSLDTKIGRSKTGVKSSFQIIQFI